MAAAVRTTPRVPGQVTPGSAPRHRPEDKHHFPSRDEAPPQHLCVEVLIIWSSCHGQIFVPMNFRVQSLSFSIVFCLTKMTTHFFRLCVSWGFGKLKFITRFRKVMFAKIGADIQTLPSPVVCQNGTKTGRPKISE